MTAINGAQYAVGLKDSFQGTGVWSFIKAKREPEAVSGECEPCKDLEEKKVRVPPKTRRDYHRKP